MSAVSRPVDIIAAYARKLRSATDGPIVIAIDGFSGAGKTPVAWDEAERHYLTSVMRRSRFDLVVSNSDSIRVSFRILTCTNLT